MLSTDQYNNVIGIGPLTAVTNDRGSNYNTTIFFVNVQDYLPEC